MMLSLADLKPLLYRPLGSTVETSNPPEGNAGVGHTIDAMFKMVEDAQLDPTIQLLSAEITHAIPNPDKRSQVSAILAWVKAHVKYVYDPLRWEKVQTPYWTTFVAGEGDCDDFSVLIGALSELRGIPVRFKTIRADPKFPKNFSHVYPLLHVGGQWLAADGIVAQSTLGWEAPASRQFGPGKIWVRR